jgi:hypothetical protein
MKVRRVVTGHDGNGKAVFASDEEVDPLTLALLPGAEFHRLWGADQVPAFPGDGRPTAQPSYFPPVGGYRFGLFTGAAHYSTWAVSLWLPDRIAAASPATNEPIRPSRSPQPAPRPIQSSSFTSITPASPSP